MRLTMQFTGLGGLLAEMKLDSSFLASFAGCPSNVSFTQAGDRDVRSLEASKTFYDILAVWRENLC